jgi:hypothetical protein
MRRSTYVDSSTGTVDGTFTPLRFSVAAPAVVAGGSVMKRVAVAVDAWRLSKIFLAKPLRKGGIRVEPFPVATRTLGGTFDELPVEADEDDIDDDEYS